MKPLKHIGKMKNTGAKVLVVFRTLPGESNHSLVLPVAQLPDSYHDSIMKLVEEEQAQDSFEFGEIMFTRRFPDGRPMLLAMQADGRLQKVATDTVTMTPTPNDTISLDQLNILIAEQKNCAVDDLCNFVSGASEKEETQTKETESVSTKVENSVKINDPLTDQDLAKSYRSQADALYKEAARLRKQADEIDPPKKKVTKSELSVEASV